MGSEKEADQSKVQLVYEGKEKQNNDSYYKTQRRKNSIEKDART